MGRLALREQAIQNGSTPKEATWIARNALDFGQGGTLTKAADKGIPYLNAGVQAGRGLMREFRDHPARASFKAAQVAAVAAGLAYWNRERNKEAWESISDREKEQNWIVTTPFQKDGKWMYFRVPKDQGARIFASIAETLTEKAQGVDVNTDKIRMAASDISPVGVSSVPPIYSALAGYKYNKDFWRNQDIWQGRDVPPASEFTADTPPAYVQLGELTGLSPERTQSAVSKLIPANPYTSLMGEAWNIVAPDDKKLNQSMAEHISKLPFARRVVRFTTPTEIDRDDENKAKRLGVETEGKTPRVAKAEVRQAERMDNATRQRNDVEQDRIIARMKSGDADESDMREFMASITDRNEKDRLEARQKKRSPSSPRPIYAPVN
jgi:hypothetical protein